MKKLLAILMILVMCVSLVACGGADKQPAIDSYNQLATIYNTFVDISNQDLSGWTDEDIEFFNGCADVITDYGTKLETEDNFTQEEVDEMVEMFDEFRGIIEEYLEEYEK